MSHQGWSDSDDEEGLADTRGDGYTSVHLGIPSDPIEENDDLQDAYVSRIGGTPAFLSYPHPSPNASKCKVCDAPSELLVQMLCNLDESPFERVLYVWGCSKSTCQRKEGSVRAWRALRLDEKYARKLKKKQEKKIQGQLEKQSKLNQPASSAHNPFSSGASNPFSSNTPNPFSSEGFGDQMVGTNHSSAPTTQKEARDSSSDAEDSSDEEGDQGEERKVPEEAKLDDLSKQLETTSLGPSVDWSKQPSYPPIYLETESEYLPPAPKMKATSNITQDSGGGDDWGKEMWEESPNVDNVFVRFTMRLDARPSQCVRYDLDGQPLFYQAEAVYRSLHSIPAGTSVPVTGAAFAVASAPYKSYNPVASPLLPKCSICQSSRRFECQLMPNLLNKLKRSGAGQHMEWGTCLVFTCAKDCAQTDAGLELKGCWREEVVLVQWEE